jgi:hypothetical protein
VKATLTPIYHSSVAGMAAMMLLLSACGGQEAGSDSAQTAGSELGSESDLLPADGSGPEGDAIGPTTVSVVVELPAGQTLNGMAIVALEDVSYADVPATELGRVELPVTELRDQGAKVDIFLPLPLDGSTDVNATVHIDVDGNGEVSEGDWMSTEMVLVTGFAGTTVSVPIVQI